MQGLSQYIPCNWVGNVLTVVSTPHFVIREAASLRYLVVSLQRELRKSLFGIFKLNIINYYIILVIYYLKCSKTELFIIGLQSGVVD